MAKTQYKGVFKDSNGKYFYQVELGTDKITGKRIQKKSRKSTLGKSFSTVKEARDEMIRVQNQYNQSDGIFDYNMTFERFINTEYLVAYRAGKQPATIMSAEYNFQHLVERFGRKKLRDLTVRDVEAFRLYMLNEQPWKQSYCKQIWNRFRLSLDYAVKMGYIETNPCRRTDGIPLGKQFSDFWTFDEFQKVIDLMNLRVYREHRDFIVIWLMYFTGCRVHEACALKWDDIDFKNKRLRVNKTLEMRHDEDGHFRFYTKPTTKTAAGMRWIELDDVTIDYLKRWKKIQVGGEAEDYIFTLYGDCMFRWNIAAAMKKYSNRAGVKNLTGRGLRHSHASYLIVVLQKDILYVAWRLGHTNPAVTLRHYSHWFNGRGSVETEELTASILSNGLADLDKKYKPAKTPAKEDL
ncbi:tyrosine-type recombinase/integrase [Lactococcus petauri]|uniref:tyrosine-type recombinase/integrase n=1 Tax=Lactococcus petauri TaxID=1940789 RepID=UPI0022E93236|nr:site-specific integrase [Lactococcus petauri]